VNKKYFVVHGGISPNLNELNEINHINRFQEIPLQGVFCDLLWSDPINEEIEENEFILTI
jgi:serine/threonine-protein phosphatase 2B catalytic subunit